MPPSPARLILVRHARPDVRPEIPAAQWPLSEQGCRAASRLAERIAPWSPRRALTSTEPKAAATGAIIAARLAIPCDLFPGLHEHERRTVSFSPDPAVFEAAVAQFFTRPSELVLGDETADAAHARFRDAVTRALAAYPDDRPLLIATHGTVLTLYVARANGLDPLPFWRILGQPAAIILDAHDRIVHIEGPPPP